MERTNGGAGAAWSVPALLIMLIDFQWFRPVSAHYPRHWLTRNEGVLILGCTDALTH